MRDTTKWSIKHFQLAEYICPKLIEVAKKKSAITYGELATYAKIHHRPLQYPLHIIQNYCANNDLPGLTILVQNKKGVVGAGSNIRDPEEVKKERGMVYAFDWDKIVFHFRK